VREKCLRFPDNCVTEIECGSYSTAQLIGKFGVHFELPSKYRVLVIPDNSKKIDEFLKLHTN